MTLVNAETGEIVAPLSSAEARDLTDTIKSNVDSLWSLLKESYDREAWRALGYASWRDYATTEFGMSKTHAYRLLDQAQVIAELEAAAGCDRKDSPIGEIPEAQTRVLKADLAAAKAAVEEATKGDKTPEEKGAAVATALSNLSQSLGAKQREDAARRAEERQAPKATTDEILDFVNEGEDVKVAVLRKRFADSLVRACSAFNFDVDAVAPYLDEGDWELVRLSCEQAADWFGRLLDQRPKSLRVMKGGRS